MANLSDAFGTIRVKRVGKEFLAFLKKVQGEKSDAYYTLVDRDDLTATVNENGDLTIEFNTFGRWSYSSNIEGYLMGEWMHSDNDKTAYERFIKAFIKADGEIEIDYQDSDPACDWMGKGIWSMTVENKEVKYHDGFVTDDVSISGYAEMNGESEHWALAYIHGDDAANAYDKYLEENKDKEPVDADTWYDNIYEMEA